MATTLRPKGPESDRLVAPDLLRLAVQLLREAGDKGLTREQLVEEMQVTSTRTVDRAITLLRDQGATITRVWDTVPRRLRLVLAKGPKWDETLSAHARLALKVALATLDQGGSNVWADHLKAFEQLAEQHLSSQDRKIFEGLRAKVIVHGSVKGGRTSDSSSGTLVTLLQVLGEPVYTKAVQLTYASASTNREKDYQVVPYLLTHDVFSGGAFLLAWDADSKMPRHFRLSRIRKVVQGRTSPLLPNERQLLDRCAHFQIGGWIGTDTPFEVKARIHGKNWCQALLEACPALPEAAVAKEGAEAVILTFKATGMDAPARWLLQFGPDAEVLEPTEFREHVIGRLKAAVARYR